MLAPDLTIVAASDSYLAATMTERREIIGKKMFEVFPDNPDDPAATGVANLSASLERVLSMRAPDTMAVQKHDIRRPASRGGTFEERWWSPVNTPVLDSSGEVQWIIHRVEDVTELMRLKRERSRRKDGTAKLRLRTEKLEAELFRRGQELQEANERLRDANQKCEIQLSALAESEREFRELAEAMPQLVWIADESGSIIYTNRRWYEQTGLPQELSLGETWVQGLHPDDRERCLAEWRRSVTTGNLYQLEIRIRSANGEYRRSLARAVPIRDEHGKLIRWFGTNTDIEDSKRAEEWTRQVQKLESIRVLAGGIAHDFNNLLTGIIGSASLVMAAVPEAPARQLENVIASAERAAQLTRQLLAYSGQGQFERKYLDLSAAVREAAEGLRVSIPGRVAVNMELQEHLPPVYMDPGHFQQILTNLVINAGEAIGEEKHGSIGIYTGLHDAAEPFEDGLGRHAPGRYVYLKVTDTGQGMDEQTRSKIFDPFFTTKFLGRGLGLAAVSGIVRALDGAILVHSGPEQGCSFKILFPVFQSPGEDGGAATGESSRGTVLVVDEEEPVRLFTAAALQREGYRVLAASSGTDAMAALENERRAPETMVMDVMLPGMSAAELLLQLLTMQPDLKVLVTGGCDEAEAMRLCRPCADARFLRKPYTAEQLAAALREIVEAT